MIARLWCRWFGHRYSPYQVLGVRRLARFCWRCDRHEYVTVGNLLPFSPRAVKFTKREVFRTYPGSDCGAPNGQPTWFAPP